MSNLPQFTLRDLVESGAHFGHVTSRWNPKMKPYIYGVRGGVHILDLQQTAPMLRKGLQAIRDVVAAGGKLLFVGTKRAASDVIAQAAEKCGQHYVNHRWLGGTLTNWATITNSIRRLETLEELLGQESHGLTKKELLQLQREYDKLRLALGGIRKLGTRPDIMFVIDTNKEALAIQEANRLGIPLVAIVDSNSNPDGIHCPVPGNDDAARAIELYCNLVAEAALEGKRMAGQEATVEFAEEMKAEERNARRKAAAPQEKQEKKTVTVEKKTVRGKAAAQSKETEVAIEEVAPVAAAAE